MKINKILFSALLLALPLTSQAAYVTNLTVVTAASVTNVNQIIDPVGWAEVNVTPANATPQSTLENLSGFGAIQNISGFKEKVVNTMVFTDTSLPDFEWTIYNKIAGGAGQSVTTASLNTSGGSSAQMRVNLGASSGGGNQYFDIDIGKFNGSTFEPTDNFPIAVGFTASSIGPDETVTVTFRLDGASDVVQVVNGSLTENNAYFGYLSTKSNPITGININWYAKPTEQTLGIDDFGFALPSANSGTVFIVQ